MHVKSEFSIVTNQKIFDTLYELQYIDNLHKWQHICYSLVFI